MPDFFSTIRSGSGSIDARVAEDVADNPSPESSFGEVSAYAPCACCARYHSAFDSGAGGPFGALNGDDRGGVGPNGKVSLDPNEAGAQIGRANLFWGNGLGQAATVTFAFRSSIAPSDMPDGTTGFTRFTDAQISATLLALSSWSDVANITFQQVTDIGDYSNNATILFGNYSDGADGAAAFAYLPGGTGMGDVSGDVWINNSLSYNAAPVNLGYGRQVLTHEIGHAIGLLHPGDYNAGEGVSIEYGPNATYYEDTRQYTLMSYFDEQNTGGDFNGAYASAPLLDDIAAAQRLYGANTTTRTSDTVYGFGSNAGRDWFVATATTAVIFAVWDAGGLDTLDFSGYAQGQIIDLRQGAFSNVGGLTGNVAIALGAVIERAVGGVGADMLMGNAVANVLTGGAGNDTIDGGLGSDTVVFSGLRADYTVTWDGRIGTVTGADGTDTLTNVEFLQFSDQTIAAAPTGGLIVAGDITNNTMTGTGFADRLAGGGGRDTLTGLGGIDTLDGGSGNDSLDGGDGDDTLIGGLGNDDLAGGAGVDLADYRGASGGVTVNLNTGTATGAAGIDTLTTIEDVRGSAFADTLTGTAGDNALFGEGGIDTLRGLAGRDTLVAGAPGQAGGAPDIVKAQATANGSIGSAVSLDGGFDLLSRPDVADASTIPHATVNAVTHGGLEYYAFTVAAGAQVLIDIDNAGFDSVVRIVNSAGTVLAVNDDNNNDGGIRTDSAVSYTFTQGGTYYVEVSQWQSGANATLVTTTPTPGRAYQLNVSVPGHSVVPIVLLGSTLDGGADDDLLIGGTGRDTLEGGTGSDTADYQSRTEAVVVALNGANTVNLSVGGVAEDTLVNVENVNGGSGDDRLTGDALANRFDGGAGDDILIGGAGDDSLDGGSGNDTLNGGGGAGDWADYSSATAGVAVNLTIATAQATGGSGSDTLTGIENLRGSSFRDILTGNDLANTLTDESGGSDILSGGAGDDLVQIARAVGGAATSVTLSGGTGDDQLAFTGNGRFSDTVTITGGEDVDTITVSGARFVDIDAGTSSDLVVMDTLGGTYEITLGTGADTLRLASTGGTFAASDVNLVRDFATGAGGDVLDLSTWLAGGALTGYTAASNPFQTGHMRLVQSGSQTLLQVDRNGGGDAFQTMLTFRNTTDSAFTAYNLGGFNPRLTQDIDGTAGPDTLNGTTAADVINGLGGDDILNGLAGGDVLNGGAGSDVLDGGAGDDTLNGGGGVADTASYASATAGVTVGLAATTAQNTGGAGLDTLIDIENVSGSAFADRLTGNAGDNRLSDTLGGNDILNGGDGNDAVVVTRRGQGAGTTVVLSGRAGQDTLSFDGARRYSDTVTLNGDDHGDVISVIGGGTVTVNAGTGSDLVTIDTLGGIYSITLGADADTLRLASTNGSFVANTGSTVRDFTTGAGGDVIDLSAWLAGGALVNYTPGSNPFLDGHMRLVQSGKFTLLQVDRNGGANGFVTLLSLRGTTATAFTAENFAGFAPFPPPVEGGTGTDVLTGTSGVDVLNGNGGNDILTGAGGGDILNGGAGNDVLNGGAGDDTLNGGAGTADVASYADATAGITVLLNSLVAQDTVGSGFDTLTGIEGLIGSAFSDAFTGNDAANTFTDTLGGNDVFNGATGDDILSIARSGSGAATTLALNGRDGADALTFTGNGRFSDTVVINGDAGADVISVTGGGTVTITAGTEADTVVIDTLGGSYSVTLGTGSDTLRLASTAGAAAAATPHLIRDFATGAGGDVLDLSAWLSGGALSGYTAGSNPFASGHLRLLQSGSQTLLQVDQNGGGNSYVTLLTFRATTASSFTTANLGGIDPSPSSQALGLADDKFIIVGPQVVPGLSDDLMIEPFDLDLHLNGDGVGSGFHAIVGGDLWARFDSVGLHALEELKRYDTPHDHWI